MGDPAGLLEEILELHADADKWAGCRFEKIRRIPNTKVGDVGQDFLERLCAECQLSTQFPENKLGKRSKQSPWDIEIDGQKFELKTATEDVHNKFQFNHIRYHRPYDAVICLGIAPSDVFFGMWCKADIATGKAGAMVSMEKGANASYKLTKSRANLHPIGQFEAELRKFLADQS